MQRGRGSRGVPVINPGGAAAAGNLVIPRRGKSKKQASDEDSLYAGDDGEEAMEIAAA